MNTNLDLSLEMLECQEAPVDADKVIAAATGFAVGLAIGVAIT
ncbi:hypothetical protein [uncultured Microbulbifer sp.]|nr:hypothetical protein [uncultured Microbulbifer sp.]